MVTAVATVVVAGCGLRYSGAQKTPGTPAAPPRHGTIALTLESTDPQLSAALLAASVAPSGEAFRRVAREYRRAGVLDQAYEYYARAAKLDPADAVSYEAMARISRDSGTPHLALADAHRAVHYAPESPTAANTLGTVLQALGYTDEAKAWYGRALALDPGAWYALNNLCYAAIMTRELAIDMCRAAVQAAPDAKAPRNNLALAHAAAGDLDGASRWFRRAGDTAEAHYNYGVTLMGRGEHTEAVAAFQKALTLNPNHAQAALRVRQARHAAAARDLARNAQGGNEGVQP